MHPGLEILQPWAATLGQPPRLPSIAQLNEWRGPQHPRFAQVSAAELPYELHIAQNGEVPTRTDNWHDAFNALCWLAWPDCKWAIHRGHRALLEAGGDGEIRRRSPQRDVLTLLDESGAIVLSSDPSLFESLRAGDWQTLFVTHRERLKRHARLLLLGHATLDDLRSPRMGTTVKCLLFEVPAEVLRRSPIEIRAHADALAAQLITENNGLGRGRQYPPLPIAGWPGWHLHNSEPGFYANHPDVFRRRHPEALAQTK